MDLAGATSLWETVFALHPDSETAALALARSYSLLARASEQPKVWLGLATDMVERAFLISLGEGRVRHTRELAELIVVAGDRARADRLFASALGQGLQAGSMQPTPPPARSEDPDGYYSALVDYADTCALFGASDEASAFYELAIRSHPDNSTEALTRWVWLAEDEQRYAEVKRIIEMYTTPEQRRAMVLPAFQLRTALAKLNADSPTPEGAARLAEIDAEIAAIRSDYALDESGMQTDAADAPYGSASIGSAEAVGQIAPMIQGVIRRRFPPAPPPIPGGPPWSHSDTTDDCRLFKQILFWYDGGGYMFTATAVNLAEIIYNESRSRPRGVQGLVAWTVRNRVFQNMKRAPGAAETYCETYAGGPRWRATHSFWESFACNDRGASEPPTSTSPACMWGRKYCAVMQGGQPYGNAHSQFNSSHVAWDNLVASGAIYVANQVLHGIVPDISTGWAPLPQNTYCNMTCANAICYHPTGELNTPSGNGPMEFRSTAYAAGNSPDCKWASGSFCLGGAGDPVYFWNRLDHTPVGGVDFVGLSLGGGWAADPDTPNQAISVRVFVDGPAGSGQPLGTFVANEPRSSSDPLESGHGFSFQVPTRFGWGTGYHVFYIYAINSSASGSPTIFVEPQAPF